jgi:hypothetical protein
MDAPQPDQRDDGDHRTISAEAVKQMLANMQEAVVTAEPETRRALLKGVIATLQDVLLSGDRV